MTNDELPKNQRFHMKNNWPILALLVVILVLAIGSDEFAVIGGLVLIFVMTAIIYFGINNREKGKRKNQPTNLRKHWLILALLILLTFLSIRFNEWIVFGSLTIVLSILITIFYSIFLLAKTVQHYRRIYWIPATLVLIFIMLFGCSVFFIMSYGDIPSRICQLESNTIARCEAGEDWHNGQYWMTQYWQQNHFAGLILIGEKFNEECLSALAGGRRPCTD